jgi:PKD repeat protein
VIKLTNRFAIALAFLLCIVFLGAPAAAYTTELTVTKYDPYGSVLGTQTITWEQMRDTLPVYGDGVTHYYMHGPTFDESSFDLLWDPIEEVNIDSRDYGAAMGTDVKDLCDIIGGAEPGDTIQIKAEDNFAKWFDYEDVYDPEPEQGNMVVTWYTADTAEGGGGYVSDGSYDTGMRLLFFADTSTNPWGKHVHGIWDMHETLPASRWHYYYGGAFWPSSSGLSVKYVSQINIYQPNLFTCDAAGNPVDRFLPGETVYVKGLGLDSSTSYNLWIQGEPVLLTPLDALERPLMGGKYIFSTANDPSGAQETVTTDANGDFAPVAVWTAAETQGEYDIAADNQASGTVGTYDSHDEIDNPGWEGFKVKEPSVPPVADFSADVTSGAVPLTVSFTDASTGTAPLTYAWDFDNDGTVDSTEQNPSYTYDTAGTYTVKLTVTNEAGSDDEVKTAYITAIDVPLADFVADVTSGELPLTVTFTDLSTGGNINTWNWDFGDRSTSTEQNPVHTYEKKGTYTVTLTVTNDLGTDTLKKAKYITVLTGSAEGPTAAFTADITEGEAPLTVTFTDQSTGDPTGWSWDFGDGTTSTEQNPVHEYTAAGAYSVSLTVANDAGSDTMTMRRYITVSAPNLGPIADFNAEPLTGAAPLTVQFTDLSTGSPISWEWSFGDRSTSTEQSPQHTYVKKGSYTVSLTVSNADGSDTLKVSKYIIVA